MERFLFVGLPFLFGTTSLYANFWIFEYATQSCQTIDSPVTYKRLGMKVEYIQKDNVWIVNGQGINAWITEDYNVCNSLLRSMVNYERLNRR